MFAKPLGAVVASILILSGFGPASGVAYAAQKPFEGVTVTVNSFGGNLDDVLVDNVSKPLQAKYGMIVRMVPSAVAAAYTKLMMSRANPPFDLLITDDITLRAAVRAGLVEKLTAAEVPNMAELYPNFMPLGGYGLPIFASCVALVYNKDHIKDPPQSMSDFAKPEFRGRVGIFNLESVGGIVSLIALAEARGGSINDLGPGFAALETIKPNLATATSSPVELFNLLQRGEIWASMYWSGRANSLIDDGVHLGVVAPNEGLRTTLDFISLVKGSKVRAPALKYINQIVSPQTSLAIARSAYYGPTNKTVTLPPNLEHRVLPYGAAVIASMRPVDWDVVVKDRGAWIERWNRDMR